jgi:hypothetical protein
MGLGYSRELQAKDDVLQLTDRLHNKKSKRADVSSDTDGNQLATGNKKRRLVKGEVNKEEGEEEEEEFGIKKEEEIEDDLHQDKDEDSRKPPAVVKEDEDETEDGEGILQLDRDEWGDSKKPPADVKEEEGYGYETEENENGGDLLLWDNDEWEDSKKPSAAVKKEVKDEVGHEYSTGKIDEKGNWEQLATREDNDDQATYLPDEIASTKALLPPARSSDTATSVKTASSPAMTVTKPKSAKHVAHAATPVSIVQAKSAPNLAVEKLGAPGPGNVCNENKTLSEGIEQPGITRKDYGKKWNLHFKKLQDYNGKHGHCEFFGAVDPFTFIFESLH